MGCQSKSEEVRTSNDVPGRLEESLEDGKDRVEDGVDGRQEGAKCRVRGGNCQSNVDAGSEDSGANELDNLGDGVGDGCDGRHGEEYGRE